MFGEDNLTNLDGVGKPNPSMGFPGHKFGDFNSAPLLFEKGHKNIEHGLRQRAAPISGCSMDVNLLRRLGVRVGYGFEPQHPFIL